LRSADVSEIGIRQQGAGNATVTTLLLARPMPLPAADVRDEGLTSRRVLALVNQARASPRL
jgi:hypothetical protein